MPFHFVKISITPLGSKDGKPIPVTVGGWEAGLPFEEKSAASFHRMISDRLAERIPFTLVHNFEVALVTFWADDPADIPDHADMVFGTWIEVLREVDTLIAQMQVGAI